MFSFSGGGKLAAYSTENSIIYLAQTDTTVGFLSDNMAQLNIIKGRSLNQPCILCVSALKELNVRIPNNFKRFVRNSKRMTFILPSRFSFRMSKDGFHQRFLQKMGALYSTSANETGKSFDMEFAASRADIIVEDFRGLYEGKPSTIMKIGKIRIKKLR